MLFANEIAVMMIRNIFVSGNYIDFHAKAYINIAYCEKKTLIWNDKTEKESIVQVLFDQLYAYYLILHFRNLCIM